MKTKIIISSFFLILLAFSGYSQKTQKDTDSYRYKMENSKLKLKKTYFNFGNIYNTETKTQSTEIFNNTDEPMVITLSGIPKVPDYVTATISPKVIPAKSKGTLTIKYDASKNKDSNGKQKWAYQNGKVYLSIGKPNTEAPKHVQNRSNGISIRANIQEDFRNLSEKELAQAPKIVFTNKTFDFGKVNQGEEVVHEFVFKNTGKKDLEIRKVKGS